MGPSNLHQSRTALKHAGVATSVVFLASGAMFGTWASRLPALRHDLDASDPELGLALLGMSLGSVLAMPVTGRLTTRFGSGRIVLLGSAVASALLIALPWLPSVLALGAVLVPWGAAYGSWDVAMNVHGSTVERRAGRVWMSRYHAMWSVGGITGSGIGALAAWAGVAVTTHFSMAAVALLTAVVLALRGFVSDRASEEAHQRPPHSLIDARIIAIGVVTLAATLIEGAAGDWLALYLADVRGSAAGPAAVGYTAFAAAMAVGRFAGTPIVRRLGRPRAVRLAGVVSGVGVTVTLTAPHLLGAYAGALLWGAGVAILFPLAMSAAGDTPGNPADAIAVVSTIGYGGFLLGPPLIGFVAGVIGLGNALWLLLALSGVAVALAPALRSPASVRRS